MIPEPRSLVMIWKLETQRSLFHYAMVYLDAIISRLPSALLPWVALASVVQLLHLIRYLDIGSIGIPTSYLEHVPMLRHPCRSNLKLLCHKRYPPFTGWSGKYLARLVCVTYSTHRHLHSYWYLTFEHYDTAYSYLVGVKSSRSVPLQVAC